MYYRLTIHYYAEQALAGIEPYPNACYGEWGPQHYRPHDIDFDREPLRGDFEQVVKYVPWMSVWKTPDESGVSQMADILASEWPYLAFGYKGSQCPIMRGDLQVGRLDLYKNELHVGSGYGGRSCSADFSVLSKLIGRVKGKERQDEAHRYAGWRENRARELVHDGLDATEAWKCVLREGGFRKS